MTRWMARCGVNVVGIDISDRFFPALDVAGVELRTTDVRTATFRGKFDVVYARMVLHHLPERDLLVRRLATYLVPGGHLLVEDPHFDLATRIGGPPFEAFYHHVARRMLDLGVDYNFGGRLPHLLREASLDAVDAAYSVPLAFKASPGAAYLLDSLRTIRPVLLAHGWYDEAELGELESQLQSDDLLATAAPIVSCWGTKPE
jgi:SAM-dependent methyltransferase